MDDLDRLSEDLFQKFWNGDDTDWDELARYVQRLLLEARLDELQKNFTGESYTDYVNKLLSQLKELEG